MIIKINGNGRNNYCKDISDISEYDEEEVLITAFCIFKITDIEGNYYYLDCEGYQISNLKNKIFRYLNIKY